jgi:hypothetical protein
LWPLAATIDNTDPAIIEYPEAGIALMYPVDRMFGHFFMFFEIFAHLIWLSRDASVRRSIVTRRDLIIHMVAKSVYDSQKLFMYKTPYKCIYGSYISIINTV